MNISRLLVTVVMLVALVTTGASAFVFTGSLTSEDGGIITHPLWEVATLGWTVTLLPNQVWRYDYTFMVSDGSMQPKDISHVLIEASPNFTMADILDTNWEPGKVEVQMWNPGAGNPMMPGSMYGIKFDSVTSYPGQSSGTVWYMSLETTRIPVWGDFYAKDGKGDAGTTEVAAWNSSFLLDDPTDPASNGSINNKILRPDTDDDLIIIPEASAPALAAMAVPMLGYLRLMRRRKTSV